jgi:hypothetical protein
MDKGSKHSKESLLKIRFAHLGKKLSEEHKRKIGLAHLGNTYNFKHGDDSLSSKHHYLYKIWTRNNYKCYNPNSPAYSYYGGRGIHIYRKWRHDYIAFKTWILSNLGERPLKHSLDRINNNGSYVPGNLRWATHSQQQRNKNPFHRKSYYIRTSITREPSSK